MKGTYVNVMLPFAAVYGLINYYETKKAGKPLYSFLTWEDNWSIVIYVSLVLFTLNVYKFLAKVTHLIKRGKDKCD